MVVKPADVPSPGGGAPRSYRLAEILAHYPGVREDHLRTLQKFGLIARPIETDGERRIAFSDLAAIRQLYKALQGGAPFKAVLRSMLASSRGQLAFDFRLEAQPAKVLTLPVPLPRAPSALRPPAAGERSEHAEAAEEYFLLASTLDDGSEANEGRAVAAYRRALEIDPDLVPALINLANIHYAKDELIEALALYERAARLDPGVFEGHFNLGNIHHDLGRYHEAEGCYRRALALNPSYPEGHLYLAVALEKAGQSDAARPHWKAYVSLEPDGEWVDLAREFSE